MATFLITLKGTAEGFQGFIDNPVDRKPAAQRLADGIGASLDNYWFAVGSDTLYFTLSNIDEIGLHAFVTSLVASNVSISIKAEQLLTSAEAVAAFKKAGNIVKYYKPPQG